MQVDVEFLCSTEGVATGETHTGLRTVAATGTAYSVGLEIEVIGFIEDAVQQQVERVALLK